MTNAWYYEEKDFEGKWKGRIAHGTKPVADPKVGTKRKIRNVRELTKDDARLIVAQFKRKYRTEESYGTTDGSSDTIGDTPP